jgi:hypothetical protein
MKEYIDLAFFTMWEKYLHTVKNILLETEKTGNARVITKINEPEISDQEYEDQTKRSDFNVFLPTIFLFYHWIELMFKWLLKLQKKTFEPNHKISKLYSEISCNKDNKEFINITKKYITATKSLPIIWDFLKKNKQSIDKFYEIFRYPSDKDEKNIYNFFQLKYTEEKGVKFAKQVIEDIDIINKRVVTTYRNTKDHK